MRGRWESMRSVLAVLIPVFRAAVPVIVGAQGAVLRQMYLALRTAHHQRRLLLRSRALLLALSCLLSLQAAPQAQGEPHQQGKKDEFDQSHETGLCREWSRALPLHAATRVELGSGPQCIPWPAHAKAILRLRVRSACRTIGRILSQEKQHDGDIAHRDGPAEHAGG